MSPLHAYCNCWQAIHGTDAHLFWRIRLLDPVKSSSRGASTGCHSWSSQSSMVPVVPKPPDLAELTELRRAIFQTIGSARTNNPIAAKLCHHVYRKPLNPDVTCLAPVLFCSPSWAGAVYTMAGICLPALIGTPLHIHDAKYLSFLCPLAWECPCGVADNEVVRGLAPLTNSKNACCLLQLPSSSLLFLSNLFRCAISCFLVKVDFLGHAMPRY